MDPVLFSKYKTSTGVEKARLLSAIVLEETPMVRRAVKKALNRSALPSEIEDLVQTGLIGLLTAVDKWEPEKGPWAPYARSWIQHEAYKSRPSQIVVHV